MLRIHFLWVYQELFLGRRDARLELTQLSLTNGLSQPVTIIFGNLPKE
jgi:hypothetical protein